jgi:hypothetical protein
MPDPADNQSEERMIMTVQGPVASSAIAGRVVSCHENLLIQSSMLFRGKEEDKMTDDGTDTKMAAMSMNILGRLREDPFSCLDNCVLNQEENAEAELRQVFFLLEHVFLLPEAFHRMQSWHAREGIYIRFS